MAVHFRATAICDSEADLPALVAGAAEGEGAYCATEGTFWRMVSGAWSARPSVGETGPKGDKGDKGDIGNQGPQGNPGSNGTNGTNGVQCYALTVTAANASTTTDAQTIYFGALAGLAPSTTVDLAPIYIPKAGTIKAAYITAHSATAGTNEAWVLHIRKNNSADTQIASVSLNTANRLWSNTGLSIAVAQGDRIEIKSVNPTWATNPANVRFGGSIYIEV